MTTVGALTVTFGENGAITITGPSPWVELTGTVASDGSFTAQGRGSVAGFPGVLVTFTGILQFDANGMATGITGTLIADAENSILPANMSGVRNPAVYNVTGTLASGY